MHTKQRKAPWLGSLIFLLSEDSPTEGLQALRTEAAHLKLRDELLYCHNYDNKWQNDFFFLLVIGAVLFELLLKPTRHVSPQLC